MAERRWGRPAIGSTQAVDLPGIGIVNSPDEIATWPIAEQKLYAHRVIQRVLRHHPRFVPMACGFCKDAPGFKRIFAHHDDYTKPFTVLFMCLACNTKRHRG